MRKYSNYAVISMSIWVPVSSYIVYTLHGNRISSVSNERIIFSLLFLPDTLELTPELAFLIEYITYKHLEFSETLACFPFS